MGLSRETRILTLLVIDTTFFFIEIISGYAVGSLALISDAFHMLNDVMSLVVAYYAVKLASRPSSSRNSYGWQRSEVLGALVNGVFLLALCFSIFMEAIERFFNVNEISQPKLVVIVGCLGLASNVIGLFLFHEHGHSHGHDHSHGSDETPTIVEPPASPSGRNGSISRTRSPSVPANSRPSHGRSDSFGSLYGHPAQTRAAVIETAHEYGYGRQQGSISLGPGGAFSPRDNEGSGPLSPNGGVNSFSHHVRTRSKGGAGKKNSISEETTPAPAPATYAAAVSGHSHEHNDSHDHDHNDHSHAHKHDHAGENGHSHDHDHDHDHGKGKAMAHSHDEAEAGGHSHSHGGGGGGHGHSHGNMNMRGVFLHVLGDALGNVGVISAGLVIMFAEGRWKYYFDPAISLFITCIIFSSALPLVKSASYILLQGVPTHISLEDVRHGIRSVKGVLSLHELHVWQLSEKTVVASVHVLVSRDSDYMAVAEKIRQVLHDNGVHSSTIQPEFGDVGDADSDVSETACLIRCPPEDCDADTCCPPPGGKAVDVESNQGTAAQAGAPSSTQ